MIFDQTLDRGFLMVPERTYANDLRLKVRGERETLRLNLTDFIPSSQTEIFYSNPLRKRIG